LPRRASLPRRSFLAASLAAPSLARARPRRQVDLLLDWKAMPTYVAFYLARELGLFAGRGVDVTIKQGRGATIAAQMIGESPEYWLGTSSGAATALGRARGLDIASLSVLYRNTPSVVFSRAEAPITRPSDLYGKRIGLVPGSVTVDEYRALLAAQRLDRARITEVPVGWTAAPLHDGKVDALIDYEEMLPAELMARGERIAVLRLAEHGVQVYSLNLIVHRPAWQQAERREIALAVRAALLEACSRVQRAPGEATELFCRLFPAFEPAYVARAIGIVGRELGPPPLGTQTPSGWQATLDHLARLGLLARPVTVDEVAIL
jgi:ABC-type nitrate/sulfonate/bicarbonate transport system substrate-binding protein